MNDNDDMYPSNAATTTTMSATTCNRSALTARIASGAVGSLLTSLIVTPLEVVKVRMQAEAATLSHSNHNKFVPCPKGCGTFVMFNGHMDCILSKQSVPYFQKNSTATIATTTSHRQPTASSLGTWSMMRRIFAQEGFVGLYAGLRPTLIMAVPNTIMYFTAYDELIFRFRQQVADNNNFSSVAWCLPLVAGGLARWVSSTVTAPLEYLRTRQAAAVNSSLVGFQTIWQQEGWTAFYSGLRPTLWRDVPFSAIYWFTMEELRWMWKQQATTTPNPGEQAAQAFVNGATAGMIAAACTTPFDVIKTRQQSSSSAGWAAATSTTMGRSSSTMAMTAAATTTACHHDGAIALERLGTFPLLRHIAMTEGVAGLWRGNQARMLKVAPGCAIMISSYEFGKRILESPSS